MSAALDPSAARIVSTLRHRLALGLACRDAVSGLAALGPLAVELESIGPFAIPGGLLQAHGIARHALPWAGRVKTLMDLAAKRGVPADWVVRIHGDPGVPGATWDASGTPGFTCPRRLRLRPVLPLGVPATGLDNARSVTLRPGAAFPLAGAASAIRGSVLHAAAVPMPWARVVATLPDTETDLAAALVVGRAAADDRGDFLLVLEGQAVAGAALPRAAAVRLWGFGPVAPPPAGAADPLAALPIEDAGTDADSPLLRGEVVPAPYTRTVSRTIAVPLSTVASGPAAILTLP